MCHKIKSLVATLTPQPSQFLLEFSGGSKFESRVNNYSFNNNFNDDYSIRQVSYENPKTQPETKENNSSYKVGDFIIHKVYGEGIIVSLDDATTGKICFTARGEIKTFDLTHQSIRRK